MMHVHAEQLEIVLRIEVLSAVMHSVKVSNTVTQSVYATAQIMHSIQPRLPCSPITCLAYSDITLC